MKLCRFQKHEMWVFYTDPLLVCESGWHMIECTCYFLGEYVELSTWNVNKSSLTCQEEYNATLPSIHSEDVGLCAAILTLILFIFYVSKINNCTMYSMWMVHWAMVDRLVGEQFSGSDFPATKNLIAMVSRNKIKPVKTASTHIMYNMWEKN